MIININFPFRGYETILLVAVIDKSQGGQSLENNFIRKWKPVRASPHAQLTAEKFLEDN